MNVRTLEEMLHAPDVYIKGCRKSLLKFAVEARGPGMVCEFGVASATTLKRIAAQVAPETVHGFDSFEGLPEDWTVGNRKGKYAVDVSTIEFPENACIHTGMFFDTIPVFLTQYKDTIGFLHVDCDLYSSTREVLFGLRKRLQAGTVIQFDEFWKYPGYEEHEIKAFAEFLNETGKKCKPFGRVASAESCGWANAQAAFVLV